MWIEANDIDNATKVVFTNSSNTTSTASRSLSQIPSWPNGATKFSIDAVPNGTNAGFTQSFVTGLGLQTPSNAGASALGPFHYTETAGFFGTSKVIKFAGAGVDGVIPTSTSTREIPLYYSGSAPDYPNKQYLYDFGLMQCNDATCSDPTEVSEITKDQFNQDLHFRVSVYDENANTVEEAPKTPFLIAFSGRWHF